MKGKYVALKRTAENSRVSETVKSWKSYTCFSADYLSKVHAVSYYVGWLVGV